MRSTRRIRAAAIAALITGTLVVTGCAADEPAATPSPTRTAAFTTDDEAYAAAEKTYRAYIDALNDVDYSDPSTFDDLYHWSTGSQLANDKKGATRFHADGAKTSGKARVTLLEPGDISSDRATITLAGCLNVSEVKAWDENGQSLVAADRDPVQTIVIILKRMTRSPTGYLVSDTAGRTGDPECG